MLLRYDLRDEDGRSLPQLTKDEIHSIEVAALESLPVAPKRGKFATAMSDRLDDLGPRLSFLKRVPASILSTGLALIDAEEYEWLKDRFGSYYLLTTPMPLVELERRRIVKIAYEEFTELDSSLRSRMAWRPTPLEFQKEDIASASSYHFELHVPPGIDIVSADLLDGGASVAARSPVIINSVCGLNYNPTQDEHKVASADVAFDIRPSKTGPLNMAMTSCWAATLVTLVAAVFEPTMRASRAGDLVLLFLAVPGIVMTLIFRQGEHRLASQLLLIVRRMTIASAALLFGTAFCFVIFSTDKSSRAGIIVILGFELILTAAVTCAWACFDPLEVVSNWCTDFWLAAAKVFGEDNWTWARDLELKLWEPKNTRGISTNESPMVGRE